MKAFKLPTKVTLFCFAKNGMGFF